MSKLRSLRVAAFALILPSCVQALHLTRGRADGQRKRKSSNELLTAISRVALPLTLFGSTNQHLAEGFAHLPHAPHKARTWAHMDRPTYSKKVDSAAASLPRQGQAQAQEDDISVIDESKLTPWTRINFSLLKPADSDAGDGHHHRNKMKDSREKSEPNLNTASVKNPYVQEWSGGHVRSEWSDWSSRHVRSHLDTTNIMHLLRGGKRNTGDRNNRGGHPQLLFENPSRGFGYNKDDSEGWSWPPRVGQRHRSLLELTIREGWLQLKEAIQKHADDTVGDHDQLQKQDHDYTPSSGGSDSLQHDQQQFRQPSRIKQSHVVPSHLDVNTMAQSDEEAEAFQQALHTVMDDQAVEKKLQEFADAQMQLYNQLLLAHNSKEELKNANAARAGELDGLGLTIQPMGEWLENNSIPDAEFDMPGQERIEEIDTQHTSSELKSKSD